MNFIDRVNKYWDEIAETETVKAMWFNVHTTGISNYIENVIFKEFKFSKRLQQNILSRIGWSIFDLHFQGFEISFDILVDLMKDIIKSECEQERISKKRLQHIMTTIDRATDDRNRFDEFEMFLKAKIIEVVMEIEMEEEINCQFDWIITE